MEDYFATNPKMVLIKEDQFIIVDIVLEEITYDFKLRAAAGSGIDSLDFDNFQFYHNNLVFDEFATPDNLGMNQNQIIYVVYGGKENVVNILH